MIKLKSWQITQSAFYLKMLVLGRQKVFYEFTTPAPSCPSTKGNADECEGI